MHVWRLLDSCSSTLQLLRIVQQMCDSLIVLETHRSVILLSMSDARQLHPRVSHCISTPHVCSYVHLRWRYQTATLACLAPATCSLYCCCCNSACARLLYLQSLALFSVALQHSIVLNSVSAPDYSSLRYCCSTYPVYTAHSACMTHIHITRCCRRAGRSDGGGGAGYDGGRGQAEHVFGLALIALDDGLHIVATAAAASVSWWSSWLCGMRGRSQRVDEQGREVSRREAEEWRCRCRWI